MSRKYLTELSLIIVAIIWALNFSIIKVTLEEIGPFAFNALRFVFAGALLIGVTKWRGFKIIVKKEHLYPVIGIGLIGNLVYQVLFIVGVNLTNAANSAVIIGTIPVWVALMAHLFTDEKLNTPKTLGIIFAFAGVGLIIFGKSTDISMSVNNAGSNALGDIIVLLSAIAWAAYTILSKKYLREYNSTQYSAFIALVGMVALVLVGIPDLLNTNYASISAIGYGGVLYSGVLSVGLAYLIWNRGVHKIGAVRTAAFQNLVPVLGVVFGVLLLNESLFLLQYLGSAAVLVGIYLSRI